jgi:putative membrane protein
MTAMVQDHQQDVAEFRTESMKATKTDVKEYAVTTLPTLEEHLKLAEQTDKAVHAE